MLTAIIFFGLYIVCAYILTEHVLDPVLRQLKKSLGMNPGKIGFIEAVFVYCFAIFTPLLLYRIFS